MGAQVMTQAIHQAAIKAAKVTVKAIALSGAEAGIRQRSMAMTWDLSQVDLPSNSYHMTDVPDTSVWS